MRRTRPKQGITSQSKVAPSAGVDEQLVAVNVVAFLAIYAMVHWITDDDFNKRYEILVVVFAILRILVGLDIIIPDKEQKLRSRTRSH